MHDTHLVDQNWDPLDPSLSAGDPVEGEAFWPLMASFQEQCPVGHSAAQGGFWYLTKYEDVRRAALNWKTYSSELRGGAAVSFDIGHQILPLDVDPPFQKELRNAMRSHFSAGAVRKMSPQIQDIMNDTIDLLTAPGPCEFVAEFSNIAAPRVVFECIYGLPKEEIDVVGPLMAVIEEDPTTASKSFSVFQEWCKKTLADRRGRGDGKRGGLFELVADGVLPGDRALTEDQQINMLHVLVAGGIETVALAFADIMRHLATKPDLRNYLSREDADIQRAVEEFLRYEAVAPHAGRAVTREITVRDTSIPQGDRVLMCWGAANRDPEAFKDPDVLDVDRPDASKHLTFGAGPHVCPGAPLAVELQVGLKELLRRLPAFHLDPTQDVEWYSKLSRGVSKLPLIFEGSIAPR